MAKSADFFISGVWKDANESITYLHIHKVNDNNSFQQGIKQSKSDVIGLINKGYGIMTIVWGYPSWNLGAKVEIVKSPFGDYLRTNRDKTAKDNLDNLIGMIPFKD